jgi:hypothetical protein
MDLRILCFTFLLSSSLGQGVEREGGVGSVPTVGWGSGPVKEEGGGGFWGSWTWDRMTRRGRWEKEMGWRCCCLGRS